jgi:hypothetical protein
MEASFCSCTEWDPCDIWWDSYPRARKHYTCCECDCSIEPGDRHQRVNSLFEGNWETFRTCLVCARIRKDYCAPMMGLRETLQEMLDVDLTRVPGEQEDDRKQLLAFEGGKSKSTPA